MMERLKRLIDVKSIVTLTLTAIFSYMVVEGEINSQEFMTIFTVVIGFYFGTQFKKSVE